MTRIQESEIIRKKILDVMRLKGITWAKLADLTGVSKACLYQYLRGAIPISDKKLEQINNALGTNFKFKTKPEKVQGRLPGIVNETQRKHAVKCARFVKGKLAIDGLKYSFLEKKLNITHSTMLQLMSTETKRFFSEAQIAVINEALGINLVHYSKK